MTAQLSNSPPLQLAAYEHLQKKGKNGEYINIFINNLLVDSDSIYAQQYLSNFSLVLV